MKQEPGRQQPGIPSLQGGEEVKLEFKNNLESQSILIRPGDPCGQLVFFEHDAVPDEASYAVRGRYNGSATVEQVR